MSAADQPLEPGIVAELRICIHEGGALSIRGPIDDPAWCLQALDNAKDAIRNRFAARGAQIVVPEKDVSVVSPLHPLGS